MTATDARIGPNAVTRLAEAAGDQLGTAACDRLFREAGLAHHRADPPQHMVAEGDVVALHRALVRLHPATAGRVAADAGTRTARYLLAHRIPRPVQAILRMLPPSLAARVLLAAIGKHAWTFAGSGRFTACVHRGVRVQVEGGPFSSHEAAEPMLAFYRAVFAHLFTTLVSPRTQVAKAQVDGMICQLEMTWARAAVPHARAEGPALG
jgi:divinyl protochlorophyllide a 8-vinyl-reductase